MESIHNSRWLTAYEASMLLQRFMPHKSANMWLEHDRRFDPLIAFFDRDGEVFYRSGDLERFVHHHLAPGSSVDFSDRRVRVDRRVHVERRHNVNIRLTPTAERRDGHGFDRRREWAADRRLERLAA